MKVHTIIHIQYVTVSAKTIHFMYFTQFHTNDYKMSIIIVAR